MGGETPNSTQETDAKQHAAGWRGRRCATQYLLRRPLTALLAECGLHEHRKRVSAETPERAIFRGDDAGRARLVPVDVARAPMRMIQKLPE